MCFTISHDVYTSTGHFFMACVMFPLLYIVLTIQFPVFKMFLECTGGPFGSRASSRLLALLCHDISIEESDYHVALKTRISSGCGFFHFFYGRGISAYW